MGVYLGTNKVNMLGGITIAQGGIDTSDATATSVDIVSGKTAYVDGKLVTGTVNEIISDNSNMLIDSSPSVSGSNLRLNAQNTNDILMRNGSWNIIDSPLSNFGDATAEDVTNGKTFTSSKGLKIVGTHICDGGLDTSDATATASDIRNGKTAYVNGKLVTGTIPSIEKQTITPTTSDKTISSGSYLNGTQTIKGDANLIASNIKSGVSIFGITGTYTGTNTASGSLVKAKAVPLTLGTFSSYGTTKSLSVTIYQNPTVSNGVITMTGVGSVVFDSTEDTGLISNLHGYYVQVNNNYYYIPNTATCTITGSYRYTVTCSEANQLVIVA